MLEPAWGTAPLAAHRTEWEKRKGDILCSPLSLYIYCAGTRLDDGGIHGGPLRFGERIETRTMEPVWQKGAPKAGSWVTPLVILNVHNHLSAALKARRILITIRSRILYKWEFRRTFYRSCESPDRESAPVRHL